MLHKGTTPNRHIVLETLLFGSLVRCCSVDVISRCRPQTESHDMYHCAAMEGVIREILVWFMWYKSSPQLSSGAVICWISWVRASISVKSVSERL